jgi:integrase
MIERGGRYYYGRNQTALGPDFPAALRKYAELHGATFEAQTFAEVAAEYLKSGTKHLAPKTLREYERQIPRLIRVFGMCGLGAIRPVHVRRYLTERGNTVSATREKALLSAVYAFARNAGIFDGQNPVAGIRGVKAHRERYVTDAEYMGLLALADGALASFLQLCYYTGQRPSDVLKMRRTDIQDGALWVTQGKTGAKVRIAIVGPLEAVLARQYAVGSVWIVRDEKGQRISLQMMRKRFWKARKEAGQDWQIRDLRAKAASDMATSKQAQALLGHSAASTTDGYIRQRVGQIVQPVTRETK